MADGRFQDRTVLITGASRGIGRALALAFAREGAHIIAIARPKSVGALEELDDAVTELGSGATLVPLDLTDGEGIDRLGGAIFERWKKLDILIGNAGILGQLTPLAHLDPKEWDKLLAINLTANWRLIRAMDPLLRQSDAGRVVFVTSGATAKCKAYWGGYSATKAGLEALARTYAHETEKTAIRVNLVDPGPIRTEMRAQAYPGEDPDTLDPPEALCPLILELADPACTRTGDLVRFRDWKQTAA